MREAATLTPAAAAPPAQQAVGALEVPVSPGELIDKIVILDIKREEIGDPAKLANVEAEYAALSAARDRTIAPSPALDALTGDLRQVNRALWRIEDDIRLCERYGNFGDAFVELARAVYKTNDERAALKRRINALLGAAFFEEKSYAG